jgi:hypothetical protein
MAPRITVWVSDRAISRRVGIALTAGFKADATLAFAATATKEQIAASPIHIGYGILDGMDHVTRLAQEAGKPWFIVDLGYFGPGHFDGNYRIAYQGTQSLFDPKIQAGSAPQAEPWWNVEGPALLCPPTEHVCRFFSVQEESWIEEATALAKNLGLKSKLRRKGDAEDLDTALENSACVITFNSSVAWRALAKGLPAFSNTAHSTVGSWHGKNVDSLESLKKLSRESLFGFMKASQLSLLEIQEGKIYGILKRYVPELN